MHKHHKFSTGLVISILIALIIICVGIFSHILFRDKAEEKKTYKVALITNSSDIDDNSFNQFAYEGISEYCDKNNISYTYYKSADDSVESNLSIVDEAVKNGAELIVCADSQLNETVYQAQDRYSDVNFILVDSEPANNDGSITQTNSNVTSLLFDDDESGFLAGYCAVKCGYDSLSVLYNTDNYTELHYYYGFVQGANYAASQEDITVELESRNIAHAKKSYPLRYVKKAIKSGTDVIFVCNKDLSETINEYALKHNGLLINVGINLSDSKAVAGSVIKNIKSAVYTSVKSYFSGKFEGGNSITLSSANDAIIFIPNTDIIKDFPEDDYKKMYKHLADDSISIISDTTVDLDDLGLENIKHDDMTPKN